MEGQRYSLRVQQNFKERDQHSKTHIYLRFLALRL
jgi:hypothetical protein